MADYQHFEAYLEENLDRLYRLAFSYTLNQADAEDVVNESVMKALQALHTLREPKYLGTWLYRIVVNTAITAQSKKAKVVAYDPLSPEWQNLTEHLVTEESNDGIQFQDLIANLNPDQRTLMILRYFEERPLWEIAEILGVNVSTIKTRLYRALHKLQNEMKETRHDNQQA